MKYEFEDEDGGYVEIEMDPGTAPRCGDVTVIGGKAFMRVPSVPLGASVRRNVDPYKSVQFSRRWPGHNDLGEPMADPAPRRDAMGRIVFNDRREAVAFGERNGTPYDEL